MRFLLDANMPRSALALLAGLGHEVDFARDIGMGAAPDAQIAARARDTSATLVTRDLDFADIRRYPPEDHAGIIVIRLPDDAVAQDIVQVLASFIRQPRFTGQLIGHLVIVEPERVRFRPALV